MRLSGISLVGLILALVIVALLCLQLFKQTSPTTGPGSIGSYQNAISQAQQSAAQQNAAATQASTTLP